MLKIGEGLQTVTAAGDLSILEQHDFAVGAGQYSAGKKARRQKREESKRVAQAIRLAEKRQATAAKMGHKIVNKAVEAHDAGDPMVYTLSADHKAIWHYDLAARNYKHQQDPLLCLEDQQSALADLNAGAAGTGYEITGLELITEPARDYTDADNVFVQFTVQETRQEVDAALAEAINA